MLTLSYRRVEEVVKREEEEIKRLKGEVIALEGVVEGMVEEGRERQRVLTEIMKGWEGKLEEARGGLKVAREEYEAGLDSQAKKKEVVGRREEREREREFLRRILEEDESKIKELEEGERMKERRRSPISFLVSTILVGKLTLHYRTLPSIIAELLGIRSSIASCLSSESTWASLEKVSRVLKTQSLS